MTTEELTALGLTEDQVGQVFAMYGKELNPLKEQLRTTAAERDSYKQQYDTASTTITGLNDKLKAFDGIDIDAAKNIDTYKQQVADAQAALAEYQKKADETEAALTRQLTQRDQTDWLTAKLDSYKVTSDYARRQLIADCMSETDGLPWKNGAFLGFDDYMKQAHEKDPSLYQIEEPGETDPAQEKKPPAFVAPVGSPSPNKKAKFEPPKLF